MASFRLLRVGLLLPLLFGAVCVACGGDGDEVQVDVEEQQPERLGPEGCYIEDERRCDCDLDEAACTENVGTWVETGCASCSA